jgi:hypothetical protein
MGLVALGGLIEPWTAAVRRDGLGHPIRLVLRVRLPDGAVVVGATCREVVDVLDWVVRSPATRLSCMIREVTRHGTRPALVCP